MVYGLQDVVRVSRMVEESPADEDHKRIERTKIDALLGWCEVTTCRRASLLGYFGETRDEPCGNCDICLRPPITWDATEAARKALSCVYRTGQRFGAGHVIDVLRGSRNEKVARFGHEQLSTFGIGTNLSEQQWRSVFRQLVVLGFLKVEHGQYGALRLEAKARELLRGETDLQLREAAEKPTRRRERNPIPLEIEDEELMEALRETRREIASAKGIPPYVIFHDATLIEMIQQRPRELADLLEISGIGQAKLEKYGQIFLDVVRAHT